jgi:pimeloyl-ACP methyl ester carboxylesterase
MIELPLSYGVMRGLEFGADSPHRVLAIHGWLDNAASFRPMAPELAGLHLVAVDLPGHGKSDHRASGATYHMVDYVADIVEAADRLGWSKFNLLGHSLGAGIGSLVAAAVPERVESLAMIDGIGPVSGQDRDAVDRLRRSVARRLRPATREPRGYPDLDRAVAARLAATDMGEPGARLIMERNLRIDADGGCTWRTDRRVAHTSPIYLPESLVRTFLSAIECRCLLVEAADGLISGRSTTAGRIAAVGDIEVVDMPGGHHLHMDRPAAVAECYRDFLVNALAAPRSSGAAS